MHVLLRTRSTFAWKSNIGESLQCWLLRDQVLYSEVNLRNPLQPDDKAQKGSNLTLKLRGISGPTEGLMSSKKFSKRFSRVIREKFLLIERDTSYISQ